jgi:hypothetical protein
VSIVAEFVTLVGGCALLIVLADRLLWRRYWKRRGFAWSDERQRLERIRHGITKR